MPVHNFTYEVTNPAGPAGAYRVSRFAADADAGRAAVARDLIAGCTVTLAAHNRGRCDPPCPGADEW